LNEVKWARARGEHIVELLEPSKTDDPGHAIEHQIRINESLLKEAKDEVSSGGGGGVGG
jgi:hypothetical protein